MTDQDNVARLVAAAKKYNFLQHRQWAVEAYRCPHDDIVAATVDAQTALNDLFDIISTLGWDVE